jgi:glycosyltransferase involved in cell wall biosynthesis
MGKKSLNILFVNSMKAGEFGGGEKWMIMAATGLIERDHRVFVGGKKGSLFLKKAAQYHLPSADFNIRSDFSPLTTLRIARFLKKNDIDVLICNFNKDVRVAGLAAKLVGKTIVLARHGVLLCKNKLKHRLTLQNLTDGIITNTQSIKNTYASYGWFTEDFVRLIYNGVDNKSAITAFEFAGVYPQKKIIFAAGRLTTQKGFDYLIESAAILKKERNDLVFIVAGDGNQRRILNEMIAGQKLTDCFRLIGHIDNIDPYLKGADLVVLSSIFEGMPNVLLEAMAVGKAVVATDVNGVRELVIHGQTGEIVPAQNSQALAGAIKKVIDLPDLLKQYGKAGYERVRQQFTVSQMIDNLESYLQAKFGEKVQQRRI